MTEYVNELSIEMRLSKLLCMQHIVDVRTLCPDFDSRGMGESQDALITYRVYADPSKTDPSEDFLTTAEPRVLAVEAICSDARVSFSVTGDELPSRYLQDFPFLAKLNRVVRDAA